MAGKKVNFYGINERMMSFDWNSIMTVNFFADALWACFSQVLQCAVNDFVSVTVCHNPSSKCAFASYPGQIRAELNRKRCLWKLRESNLNDVAMLSQAAS